MSVLDDEALAGLERDLGDRDLVREVVQLFLDQLETRKRAVTDAAEADDLVQLQREAHTLGSASAMVGAVELRALCRELETSTLPETSIATHPLMLAWAWSCSETETALRSWLARS